MVQEHKDAWPGIFAGWTQNVITQFETGVQNAFSLFVHSETRRCLDDVPALQVP